MLWIEKDFKSIVKIEFMDSTIIYDSLMTISYGYQLPIPGVISAYINFTNFDKQQYPISNIEKVYINNKLYSGKHIRTYQSILTAVPYFLFSIIFYTFSTS